MGTASFNILMAAYNASATIDASIRSVLAQTRPDFELIVVDDGSTDDTVEHIKRFAEDPRVRLLRQENAGLSSARNAAIGAGRAPYLTILDSDDLLMPRYLERVGHALDSRPSAGFAFADAWRLDDSSGRLWYRTVMSIRGAPRPVPHDPRPLAEALIRTNFVPIMFTVRRAAVERIGGFRRADGPLAEDWELLLRLVAHGYGATTVPGALGIYRRGRPGSFTADPTFMVRASHEALRVFVEEHPAPQELKALAIDQLDRRRPLPAPTAPPRRNPTWARRRLRPLAAVLRRDPLRLRPPRQVSAAFPELAGPMRRSRSPCSSAR